MRRSMGRTMKGLGGLLAAAVFLFAGCVHRSGGIAASTKPLDPNGYQELGYVEASDCLVRLLMIIPVTTGNKTRDALAEAFEKARGADALIQVTVDTVSQYWLLWSHTCTEIQGTAVSTR